MRKIPIVTTIQSTVKALEKACNYPSSEMTAQQITSHNDALDVFQYEMPEIKIIDFGDPAVEGELCLDIVKEDPWLLFGGVIAITNTMDEKKRLEQRKEQNFLFVSIRSEFERHIGHIIKILEQNQSILFNRGMYYNPEQKEKGVFISNTDPFETIFYATLLGTYLYNTNRINRDAQPSFQGAMMELLFNALEHGNCNISFDEKSAWLSKGKDMLSLIEEKKKDPKIKKKKIIITYEIDLKKTLFTIKDEGNGFNWKQFLKKDITPGLHGRGIKMSQSFVKNLTYNDLGNEVSFEIENKKHVTNLTPAILKSEQVCSFNHMQVVCNQNENTTDLYYICSGRYAVYVDKKLLSVLTPADTFIGEMAFLLNNKRSATIVAIGEGSLVKIPKKKFINLINKYPHYGIFLSRLLAGRLSRQSRDSALLKDKIKSISP